jgi:hypothetical protein
MKSILLLLSVVFSTSLFAKSERISNIYTSVKCQAELSLNTYEEEVKGESMERWALKINYTGDLDYGTSNCTQVYINVAYMGSQEMDTPGQGKRSLTFNNESMKTLEERNYDSVVFVELRDKNTGSVVERAYIIGKRIIGESH